MKVNSSNKMKIPTSTRINTSSHSSIKRGLTIFILSHAQDHITVLHGKNTMLSYPSHWSGIISTLEFNKVKINKLNHFTNQHNFALVFCTCEAPYERSRHKLAEESNANHIKVVERQHSVLSSNEKILKYFTIRAHPLCRKKT